MHASINIKEIRNILSIYYVLPAPRDIYDEYDVMLVLYHSLEIALYDMVTWIERHR